ncbi:Crp/Fnr family transcriptional regulator [Carnobacterium maltaromaticum]|uniref:Crp/Fnr family transcriptional regulator n=1 Tax=Carnobacterium maltaromaticum TaxID=2751 RepID=A0AAW9JYP4_CARML|nr:Crp/Fnr family transcriptional regulator [Carnobacterium maltaromaticum]MDZ5757450.1 Crp/Fnr family transcriptional regulator [Carnobacterium maltaromaticum]
MRNKNAEDFYSIEKIGILYNSEKLINLLLNNIKFEILNVKKNEYLIKENTDNEFIYYTKKGLLSMKKEKYIIDFFSSGEFVGLSELFMGTKSIMEISAITDSELIRFKKADVISKVLSYQEGYFYYLYNMNQMMRKVFQKQENLMMTAEKRVVLSLVKLIERFGEKTTQGFLLPKEFTNKLISEYVQCHLTTMLYIFKNLQASGAILSAYKPYMYDLEKLRSLENELVTN